MRDNTFFYSQLALSIYQSCQLRFRRRYLDGLYWPRPASEEVELGRNFHLISQRYFTSGKMESCDKELQQWLEQLLAFRPYVKQADFLPEQELRLRDGRLRLVAKYDLIAMTPDGVIIYDWKTDRHPLTRRYCDNTYQTLVYRYLLVRAGNGYLGRKITPPDVAMVYWNPRFPSSPVTLPYSETQYRRDGEQLGAMIEEIDAKDPDSFYATSEEKVCRACEYAPICHNISPDELDEEEADDLSLNWDDLEETPY